jgi:glutamyl-tRNA synthetase
MDDWIMLRPDGLPTYNFGAAIDDLTMGITLVARGDDHINNTPPQIAVFKALGATPPQYAHLPMILGEDKKKLSKRTGSVSVSLYKEDGYLPHALINFLARMGWSHGDDEVFTREQLIEWFGFDSVGKSGGVWNKEKLLWLNNHWIKQSPIEEIGALLVEQLAAGHTKKDQASGVETVVRPPLVAQNDERTHEIVKQVRERAKTMREMADQSAFFFSNGVTIDEKAGTKELLGAKAVIEAIRERTATGSFIPTELEAWAKEYAEKNTLKLGKVAQPVRVAVTGNTVSPPLFDTLVLIGKDEVLRRLDAALKWIGEKAPPAA